MPRRRTIEDLARWRESSWLYVSYYALQKPFSGMPQTRLRPERSAARARGTGSLGQGSLSLGGLGRAGWGSACRPNRQAAFSDQVHGAFDWDANDSFVLVDPVVALELGVLGVGDSPKLVPLAFFQTRLREGEGVGLRRHHRAKVGLMFVLIAVEEVVHPQPDEGDGDAHHGQTCQEVEDSSRAQVFALVVAVLETVRLLAWILSHAPAPVQVGRSRRTRGPAATY